MSDLQRAVDAIMTASADKIADPTTLRIIQRLNQESAAIGAPPVFVVGDTDYWLEPTLQRVLNDNPELRQPFVDLVMSFADKVARGER